MLLVIWLIPSLICILIMLKNCGIGCILTKETLILLIPLVSILFLVVAGIGTVRLHNIYKYFNGNGN